MKALAESAPLAAAHNVAAAAAQISTCSGHVSKEGHSDFVHGLASRAEDRFDGETIANAQLVSLPALRTRLAAATSADGAEQSGAGAAEGEPAAQVIVPRRQRVSVVMWTAYLPKPAAAAPT